MTSTFLPTHDVSELDPLKIPKHIAIIMDGNRRWARSHNLPSALGHMEGAETLTEIVRSAAEIGVKTLTVFAFSTENWLRPEEEIESLMNIFEIYLHQKRDSMVQEGIRLSAIGDLSKLPQKIQDAFSLSKEATKNCTKINLVLAINYGGRDEIRRAMIKILELNETKKLSPDEITENFIGEQLDTAMFNDPDLLIRTSGEFRVSNFLLWQICYAEIYTTPVMWPDFNSKHLFEAVVEYQNRNRRKGGG